MQCTDNRRAETSQSPGRPKPHNPVPVSVAQEHAVLVRHMGRLQSSVSALLADKEARLQALSGEVVRLRGQLVVTRTAVLWGLMPRSSAGQPTAAKRKALQAQGATHRAGLESVHPVVCQTGCVGHAHHWLSADGTCQLSGQACERPLLEKSPG
jgi:hypothetical protein